MFAKRLNVFGATLTVLAVTTACSGSNAHARATTPRPTSPPPTYRLDSTLRLNQIQELGSHKSYHHQPYPKLLAFLAKHVGTGIAASLDYGHRPLPEQFGLGVRQIELDVYADPRGGKYARPSLPLSIGLPAPDPAIMRKPGFKVIHQADVDTRSTCLTFVLCLREVKTWSDAHPGHVPMMIDVEMKDSAVTSATFDALDAEIRSVLPPEDLITPDPLHAATR